MMEKLSWLPKTPKQKIYYGLALGVLALGIAGSLAFNSQKQAKTVTEDITTVQTTVIGAAAAAQEYTYSGAVRGRYESQLAFQVGGKVIKRYVELGSTVQAGEVLAQIDARDLKQAVNAGSAQVYAAQSQVTLAESNLKRFEKLYSHGVVSKAQLEQAQNAYDMAIAAVRQSSAQLSAGENQLDYSCLYADRSGVISSLNFEAGQVVGPGQPVLTIVQDGEQEIEISVPENRIAELKKAANIKVTFWALPTVSAEGKIREVAPMADPLTRTYKVRVSLINPSPEIKLGMTASVIISDQTKQAITIPVAAIYQNGDTPCVWIVSNNTLSLRPVKTGQFAGSSVTIIEGLHPGEQIVTAGVHKLKEGQKVKSGGDAL